MKQEAALRLWQYGSNEIHLLKIIMQWSHRDLTSYFRYEDKLLVQPEFQQLHIPLCQALQTTIVFWFIAWEWLNCAISPPAVMDFCPGLSLLL